MTKQASAVHNLVDAKLKKSFIECRDEWQKLNDRANSAAAKRRQYQKEMKEFGFSVQQVKISLLLQTPEGEAEFKAEMANRLLAAAYSDADIGDQLGLFLDNNRTPAVDRSYREGQSAAMSNKAMTTAYAPETEQYRAFVKGYQDEQERQIKGGIGKLDAKKAAANAGKGKKAAPGKKRGRPAKGANADAPAGPERSLIKKADKDAKAAARAQAATSGPPRRPVAEPVTRASLAAKKADTKAEAESYFTKSTDTAGNA